MSKPTQLVNGPGNTGKKEPTIPKQAIKNPKIKRNMSMFLSIKN